MTQQGFRWAVVGVAVAIAAFLAWLVTGAEGPRTVQVASIIGQLVAPLLAAVACWWRAGRTADGRRGWLLLGGSAASWGAGQTVWCYYELIARREIPFPSLADVGYLTAVPAMLSFPAAPVLVASRLRAVFDGLLIGASLLSSAGAVALGPVFRASEAGTVAAVIGLAYPVGDVVVATAAVVSLGRGG